MPKHERTLRQVLTAEADANVGFSDLRILLLALGFDERIRGAHHIFTKTGVEEIINLQPKGTKAKPYQVRQVRALINRYRLRLQ